MSRKTLQVLSLLHLKKVFTISSAIKIWYCITYVEAYALCVRTSNSKSLRNMIVPVVSARNSCIIKNMHYHILHYSGRSERY